MQKLRDLRLNNRKKLCILRKNWLCMKKWWSETIKSGTKKGESNLMIANQVCLIIRCRRMLASFFMKVSRPKKGMTQAQWKNLQTLYQIYQIWFRSRPRSLPFCIWVKLNGLLSKISFSLQVFNRFNSSFLMAPRANYGAPKTTHPCSPSLSKRTQASVPSAIVSITFMFCR